MAADIFSSLLFSSFLFSFLYRCVKIRDPSTAKSMQK